VRKCIAIFAFLVTCGWWGQLAMGAEMIVNGNFETGSLDPWGRFGDGIGLNLGDDGASGVLRWDAAQPGVPGPGVGFLTPTAAGSHGNYVARGVWSDNDSSGADLLMGLWQSFSAPAGASSAVLSFDLFTQGNGPINGAVADVSIVSGDSNPFAGRSADNPYSVPGSAVASIGSATTLTGEFASGANPFVHYVFDVSSLLAGGGTFTLAFQLFVDGGGAVAWGIDNVSLSVEPRGTGVPEPGALALLAVGLAVLGYSRRRIA
jgi:hypothetical protein